MKLLYLTDNFLPDITGGSIRAYYNCKYLATHGVAVSVLTIHKPDTFSSSTSITKTNARSYSSLFPSAGRVLPFIWKGLKLMKRDNHAVIYATSPGFGCIVAGAVLSKLTKKPLLLEIRDPFVRPFKVSSRSYVNKNSLKGRLLKVVEGFSLKRASKIVVTNPAIKQELLSIYKMHPSKIDVIFNGADIAQFAKTKKTSFTSPTIGFFGRITKSRYVEELLQAIQATKFTLILSGPTEQDYLKHISKHYKRFRYLGNLSHEKTISVMKGCDVLFLGMIADQMMHYALPSKIFEYIAAEKPILSISPKNKDIEHLLTKYSLGKNITDNQKNIKETLHYLYKHRTSYKKKASRVKTLFSRKKMVKQLFTLLQGLC